MYLTPPGSSVLTPVFRVFYNGPEDKARQLAAPLYDLGPTHCIGGMCRFPSTTDIPPHVNFPGYDRYSVTSAHLDYPLDEDFLLETFQRFRNVVEQYPARLAPAKCVLDLRSYKKVAAVPVDRMAYSGRYDTAWLIPELQYDDPELDAIMSRELVGITSFVREAMMKKKAQMPTHRDYTAIYPNLSEGGEGKSKKVFGPNLQRLQQLKAKYDPDMVWNKWFPIVPASTD